MSNEIKVPIPSRVYNAATGGHVTGAEDIDFGQKVKHLVKYDHSGNEVSFASQLSAQNTIYVIHDDFTLTENVTVPANCVLEFDGGSISGAYTITGSNTGINAGLVKIFNTNVTLAGTWDVDEVYSEWFGAKADGVTDDVDAIQDAIEFARFTREYTVKLLKGKYAISKPLLLWASKQDNSTFTSFDYCGSVNLVGAGVKKTAIFKTNNTQSTQQDHNVDAIIIILSDRYKEGYVSPDVMDYNTICYNSRISGITLWGNGSTYDDTAHFCAYGIYTKGVFWSEFKDISIFRCSTGFYAESFSCFTNYVNFDIHFAIVGFQIVPFSGGMTTTKFEGCHMNGIYQKGYYLRGGAMLVNCSSDGGLATAIYCEKQVLQNNLVLSANLTVINYTMETSTGAFLYADEGYYKIYNSHLASPSEISVNPVAAIRLKGRATAILINCNASGYNGKGYKFADCEAGSYLAVNDKIISNCGFANYTKILYNERIKEIINPSTPYRRVVAYVPTSGVTPPSMTVTTDNNEIYAVMHKNDGGEMVLEFEGQHDLTDYQFLEVVVTTPSLPSGCRFTLYILDTLYADEYVQSPGSEIPHTLVAQSNFVEWDVLNKITLRFNIANITGSHYISFLLSCAGAATERPVTIYDAYLVK